MRALELLALRLLPSHWPILTLEIQQAHQLLDPDTLQPLPMSTAATNDAPTSIASFCAAADAGETDLSGGGGGGELPADVHGTSEPHEINFDKPPATPASPTNGGVDGPSEGGTSKDIDVQNGVHQPAWWADTPLDEVEGEMNKSCAVVLACYH